MKETTICKKCSNYFENFPIQRCDSEKAPVTDFVTGYKNASKINKSGQCEYYIKKKDTGE